MKTKIVISRMLLGFGLSSAMACSKGPASNPGLIVDTTTNQNTIRYIDTFPHSKPFVHDGMLHKQSDFDRMKTQIAAQEQPWLSGWNKLIANSHAQLTYNPNPVAKLIRGGSSREEPEPDNYGRAFNDVAAAYQLAIRWKISGDDAYAAKAVQILNAWASTCKLISGNSNIALAAGIYGYQFAVAGEMLRDYEGWAAADFTKYKQWLLDVFYSVNKAFLTTHWSTCITHYWANWDLCNLASVMAIGVLTDKRELYNYAMNYIQRGQGNGSFLKAVYHVHPDGLAQMQESGRDQGHATLCIALIGIICEIAWNQGDDLYGFDNNRILKASEYTAKYNVAKLSVPFKEYAWGSGANCDPNTHTQISADGRGSVRPMWEMLYNHYVKRKGLAAQYTQLGAQSVRPEGGGGDYGPNSGGFDQLGFGTLLYSLK